jgi:hypothetical protein
VTQLTIGRRFNGPAPSGNGGYTSGLLAAWSGLPRPVTVRLLRPPPLEEPLEVVPTDEGVELRAAGGPVASAVAASAVAWSHVAPVDVATATEAQRSYRGWRNHPFPTCFVCGPERAVGDGLRLFPGRVGPEDDERVAAVWAPTGSEGPLDEPLAWAALDCPSGWSTDLEARPLVLGQMTAEVRSPPQAGSTYVVVGRHVGTEGRKVRTASALFDVDGRLLARAEHVWLEVGPELLAELQRG